MKAISRAGAGGTLIVSVGHGGSSNVSNPEEGMFELAPRGALTIGGRNRAGVFVNVFYDVRLTNEGKSDLENDLEINPTPPRLARWRIYEEISAAFRKTRLQRVVLLTCNVGKSQGFLRKVANDWKVVIQAYRRRVGINTFTGTGSYAGQKPTRIVDFESNLSVQFAHIIIDQEEQIPFDPSITIFIGPPLP